MDCTDCDNCSDVDICSGPDAPRMTAAEANGCAGCPDCDGSCDCHDDSPIEPVAPPVTCAMIVAHVELSSQSFTCLTFATVVEAERFLTDRFGPADDNGRYGPIEQDLMRLCAGDFFLEYWDECGGINAFTICASQHGKPFTAF